MGKKISAKTLRHRVIFSMSNDQIQNSFSWRGVTFSSSTLHTLLSKVAKQLITHFFTLKIAWWSPRALVLCLEFRVQIMMCIQILPLVTLTRCCF